jgi:hypothetical protein
MIVICLDNFVFMYGNSFIPYEGNTNTLQGYVRHHDDGQTEQAVLVIHNLSSDPVVLDIAHLDILYGSRTVEGYGTVVYEIDPDLIGDYS